MWNTSPVALISQSCPIPLSACLSSKRHVIWWVRPILQYSRPLPSDRSTCFLRLSWHSFPPIFFVLAFEDLVTPGRPCGQASQTDPWQRWGPSSSSSSIKPMWLMHPSTSQHQSPKIKFQVLIIGCAKHQQDLYLAESVQHYGQSSCLPGRWGGTQLNLCNPANLVLLPPMFNLIHLLMLVSPELHLSDSLSIDWQLWQAQHWVWACVLQSWWLCIAPLPWIQSWWRWGIEDRAGIYLREVCKKAIVRQNTRNMVHALNHSWMKFICIPKGQGKACTSRGYHVQTPPAVGHPLRFGALLHLQYHWMISTTN